MIAVIIAGGSGTRLWPLSTKDYPKHLLALTNDRSLLQNTYSRVKDLADEVFVVTEKSHSRFVQRQLPQIPRKNFLAEPARRGTASCLILALSEIRRQGLDDQAIVLIWADHIIKDTKAFSLSINKAVEAAEKHEKLVFVGAEPTYASTGLGYIQKVEEVEEGVYRLKRFVEKPDKRTAQQFLTGDQYLWNTGYLTGTLSVFEGEIKRHSPKLWRNYQELNKSVLQITRKKVYMSFKSEPLERAFSEKLSDALVIAGTFDWADVGSFKDLHDINKSDKAGNYISGDNIELENVSQSYIRNETNIPVAVIGIKNVAVIATKNGLLVTDKTHAQSVREISKKLEKNKKDLKWYEKLQVQIKEILD